MVVPRTPVNDLPCRRWCRRSSARRGGEPSSPGSRAACAHRRPGGNSILPACPTCTTAPGSRWAVIASFTRAGDRREVALGVTVAIGGGGGAGTTAGGRDDGADVGGDGVGAHATATVRPRTTICRGADPDDSRSRRRHPIDGSRTGRCRCEHPPAGSQTLLDAAACALGSVPASSFRSSRGTDAQDHRRGGGRGRTARGAADLRSAVGGRVRLGGLPAGVARNVVAGTPCTPSTTFVFGLTADKSTLICSAHACGCRPAHCSARPRCRCPAPFRAPTARSG